MQQSSMEYRRLGNTSLKVSVIGYGNAWNSISQDQQQRTTEIVKRCWELGINFYDTAESYGHGEGERQLGQAFKDLQLPREDLVVTTKVFFSDKPNRIPNRWGLSRKHIIESIKNSLKRLQLDYVDVYFAHRPHFETPTEELCRAFDWCVRHGLCHYWGTSEFSAAQIADIYGICEQLHLVPPIAEQAEYNMYNRNKMETEYYHVFEQYGIGTTIWSPLLQGILTGKYNDDLNIEGRMQVFKDHPTAGGIWRRRFGDPEKAKKFQESLRQLGVVAKDIGCSQTQLAVAWTLKNKDVNIAITGATKVSQIEEICSSCDKYYKLLTPEIEKRIEQILDNKPQGYLNFKTMKQQTRRDLWVNK